MSEEYYEAGKKWIDYMAKHEFPYAVSTLWTTDNHVMWTIPIENFADIDKMYAAMAKIGEKAPDEIKSVEEGFTGTFNSSRISVYTLDFKNSMIAEGAESKSEDENFVMFDIYYFEPGSEAELNKIWDAFNALREDKGDIQSWYFYWGVMGTDSPVLWAAASAKDRMAYLEENAKMWETMGTETGKVRQKMLKYVRKEDQKRAWLQKELSYAPAKKEEKQ
jgi:hypothetical protein